MQRNLFRSFALATALVAAAPAAMADDAETDQTIDKLLGDHAAYRAVFDALKQAVQAGDAAGVAALVDYPITVAINGRKTRIPDARAFAANYAAIMTPSIAAAVKAQSYGELFVNWQGIMIGDGEVWINGICRDKACSAFDARVITVQSGPNDAAVSQPAAPKPAPAASSRPRAPVIAKAGALKTFKDWKVGCDNGLACVALGLSPDADALSGYVKLSRSGDANAVPQVTFTTWPEDQDVKVSTPSVKLSLDGGDVGGLPETALPAELDGDLVHVALPPAALPDLLLGLRSANLITMQLLDDGKPVSSQQISLAGASAALLYLDDEQNRVGTVTALAKAGPAAADTIAPPPALPVVAALPVADMADPLPKPPRTAAKPSQDCSEGADPYVAFSLPGGASLWGACASTGAYNFAYDFRIFVGGKAGQPWTFAVPGVKPDDPSWLWNAYVDADRSTLNSFFKGRGLGDCGDAVEWAFDGQGFAALTYRSMDDCRGVMREDWPVLYRAAKG